jgi:hypothetical protein
MKKTKAHSSTCECTHQLTMVLDPAKLDREQLIATRQRLLSVGVRLRLITRDGTSLDEATGG